ncbi:MULTISPECIES: hypothetical protein [Halobellus]|jgi:hypothetical protein|uniref:DUF8149 domain-containing protein n=2 Tax=Halobellus TaxID=1073986 RepID=A0A1H5ZQ72_9EURY|nr:MULTISPECIES: hypothetical protein [Halobellus]QCC48013.1 hypothetical protein DV707_10285 [Halobellus limi]SEG37885.1 hypothetical protein SAMN04488133_2095 [Halobellus limi]
MTDEETDDEPTVPIVCEDCGTTSRVPLSELRESIDTHNDHRHDGEEIAQVDPVLADALADAVADDLGLLDAE